MAAGVGPGQQWLTAGFRPCDEVRPLRLTPLPPALPLLPPSHSVPRVPLCLSWWIGVWRGGGGLNKTALISAVLTVIPVGHHSAEKLPSSPPLLTPVALLICCCSTPFIQQSLLFYSFSLSGSVCIGWICKVVRPQLRFQANQSPLTSVPCPSFKMNKQKEGDSWVQIYFWQRVIFCISSTGIEHCWALFQTTEER